MKSFYLLSIGDKFTLEPDGDTIYIVTKNRASVKENYDGYRYFFLETRKVYPVIVDKEISNPNHSITYSKNATR